MSDVRVDLKKYLSEVVVEHGRLYDALQRDDGSCPEFSAWAVRRIGELERLLEAAARRKQQIDA